MAVRNARSREELERAELAQDTAREDLAWVLSDPRGRRWVWGLLGQCGLYASGFNTNFGVTGFNLGRQSVAQGLLREITTQVPELYLQMQAEAVERDQRDRERVDSDEEILR